MPPRSRPLLALVATASLFGACAGSGERSETHADAARRPPVARAPVVDAAPPPDPLRHQPDLPPERRALLIIDGERRIVDADAAVAAGYTLVDLRDQWTPFIFAPARDAEGRPLENRYRSIFIGLADDRTDEDGRPLPEDEVNYLEVFGIPPTLSVLRTRFLADEEKACLKEIDYDLIGSVERVPFRAPGVQRRIERRIGRLERRLHAVRKRRKLKTLHELAEADERFAAQVAEVEEWRLHRAIFAEVEKRLRCEGYLKEEYRHWKGVHDRGMRLALRRFQRRHMIYEWPYLHPETLAALAKKPVEGNHDSLVRALRERVVAAASILEDGSVHGEDGPPTWKSQSGETRELRNLVEEFTRAALVQLQLDTPEKAPAFFRRYDDADFQWLRGAVRFPPYPEYYADHMELSMVIDRGDVWYEPPWDPETGERRRQPRPNMPELRLYVHHADQRIPLVRWPTTIGGWRAELAPNGYEYYRYKESDAGDRVIRKIIAGPTWVPAESTPLRGLVRRKEINGRWTRVVNYDEMGPGYLSAYGLVAGYFVIPREDKRDIDRGIRAHGSSDYMSIMSPRRYSHGCHRLLNHLAVRLYGFILNHRKMVVNGDQPIGHERQFLYEDRVYEIRLPSRGFEYELTPPLPVTVTRGNIRGRLARPIEGYVPKPGVKYPPGPVPGAGEESVESRAGGGGGAADEGEGEEG